MIKLIEQDGWRLVRQKGSHRQFQHPTKPGKTTVAGHPDGDLRAELRRWHPETGRVEQMIDTDHYLILVGGGPPTNYGAWSPDVLGCVATGNTVEECVAEMRSALAFHVEGMVDDGETPPEPSGPGVYIELTAAA